MPALLNFAHLKKINTHIYIIISHVTMKVLGAPFFHVFPGPAPNCSRRHSLGFALSLSWQLLVQQVLHPCGLKKKNTINCPKLAKHISKMIKYMQIYSNMIKNDFFSMLQCVNFNRLSPAFLAKKQLPSWSSDMGRKERMTLARRPLGGSVVSLMPFCRTGTGK